MHSVVKLEGIVGFREVSFSQFVFMLCFDRIKQLCLIFLVFGISGLVSFERFVVSFLFFKGGLWVMARKITGKENHNVQDSATGHD